MWIYNIIKPLGGKERRRFPRVESAFRINYQVGSGPPHVDCVTRDISEVGMRLNLYQRIKAGTTLKFGIYMKDAPEPDFVFGKLVWERETPGRQYPYEAGVEFSLFDPSFRSKVHTYVQSAMSAV